MKLLGQESGKTLSALEYYWRPPLIGDPLSLETPSHPRPLHGRVRLQKKLLQL